MQESYDKFKNTESEAKAPPAISTKAAVSSSLGILQDSSPEVCRTAPTGQARGRRSWKGLRMAGPGRLSEPGLLVFSANSHQGGGNAGTRQAWGIEGPHLPWQTLHMCHVAHVTP